MRKNVSIGKRFASGVLPSPQSRAKILHCRWMTETDNNRRLARLSHLSFSLFAWQHISFFLSLIPVKLHFEHVLYRFFFCTHVRIPRWNNIFHRWHARCSPVNYRFPFFLRKKPCNVLRRTSRSFVSHFLFRIVNERCMRNLRPRSIFDLGVSVINIRAAISLLVESGENGENREECEKLLLGKFIW